jgi:hypothetical protein
VAFLPIAARGSSRYAIAPMLDVFSRAVITTTADGGLIIFSAPIRYVGWALAFAILLPLSWLAWRRKIGGTLAPGMFFACFTIPTIVIPGIALERVEVSSRGLSLSTGFWFAPTRRTISFERLRALEERSEKIPQRRVERSDVFWTFHFETGAPARMKLPDLLAGNREPIVDLLRKHGVTIRTQ